jgi:F420-dependent oxidoreductase-like protein
MDAGIHFGNFTFPGNSQPIPAILAETARVAEQGGCTKFTLMDHWFQMEQRATARDPMLEGYTSLGYLAACTTSLQLGLLVTGVTYRYPGLLAKIVTTLDVLSQGRAFLGLGASWYEREHKALGVPYPPLAERFARLEETVQICLQMWSDDEGPYEGKYYQLAETICVPQPVQRPRPRILIGGNGERRTFPLVAKYADECNLFPMPPSEVRRKLGVLEEKCGDAGRDPATIKKTMLVDHPIVDRDSFLHTMEEHAKAGIELVEFTPLDADPVTFVKRLCDELLPALQEIG